MKAFENWDSIQEAGEFERPEPGAYIARIEHVEDVEKKEYLRIEWDFSEGAYKGANQDTFDRAGFWPISFIRSYKEKAWGFFKAFISAVEASNPSYRFHPERPDPAGLEGKLVGVVLGEEEYIKNNGSVGERLYVAQVRSVKAIQEGDFTPPAKKLLDASQRPKTAGRAVNVPGPAEGWDGPLPDDADVPF